MKKILTIITLLVMVALVGSTVDAAKRKTSSKRKTKAKTTATITKTASGISIDEFVYRNGQADAQCGTVFSMRSQDVMGGMLRGMFDFTLTEDRTEMRDADYTGTEPEWYEARIQTYTKDVNGETTTVVLDESSKFIITFPNKADYDTFLKGCKIYGYKYNYASDGLTYYKDIAKCHWDGSSITADPAHLQITIEAVWEP